MDRVGRERENEALAVHSGGESNPIIAAYVFSETLLGLSLAALQGGD